ncbi:MAG: outer membrane beta-barrel protein [Pyrinomonadaceae bacterium]
MNTKTGCAAALVLLCLFSGYTEARAQAADTPRFEVGAQFSSLTVNNNFDNTQPGFGGRFTVNLNDNFAVEAETNYYPKEERFRTDNTGGRGVQALFGVKAGKRYDKFGLFAKARPGLIHFTGAQRITGFTVQDFQGQRFIIPDFRTHGVTHFATDVGGVVEFYPSRRIVTRFDLGDTIIRYGGFDSPSFPGGTFRVESTTRHNFQFNAGIGLRF